jgi:hypothetical protein
MDSFCTRPSRLFSGDPSALFAQDSQFLNVATTIAAGLSTPFSFNLDTPQVPNSQFWHLPKVSVVIFTPSPNDIDNLSDNQMSLWLCPGSMQGSSVQDDSGTINGVNLNNVGIQINATLFNLLNDTTGIKGGIQEVVFEGPIEIPPLWFLRFCIYDDGSGLNVLRAGSTVSIRAQQQIIQLGFEKSS